MTEYNEVEQAASIETWMQRVAVSAAEEPLRNAVSAVLDVLRTGRKNRESGPFLTVVMRTQGKKPEAFQDALVTLFGQSDQDFEVLIMGHDLSPESADFVRRVVAAQAPSFRDRITVNEVVGGGRSRPLNEALLLGRGEYFAFFDDDDLVFGHWVETFHEAARKAPGRLVRAIAATQRMEAENWLGERHGFRSTTWPRAEYAKTFDYARHLERNHSPFMSVAFPRELFTTWGESFDERLDVCEDWDLILRGAFLLGVQSVNELTVIYRLWTGVTSSYTEHEREAWQRSEALVRDRLNRYPAIMPEGSAQAIVHGLQERDERQSYDPRIDAMMNSTSWRITAPMRRAVRITRRLLRRQQAPGN